MASRQAMSRSRVGGARSGLRLSGLYINNNIGIAFP
jgi:hypothetical protein